MTLLKQIDDVVQFQRCNEYIQIDPIIIERAKRLFSAFEIVGHTHVHAYDTGVPNRFGLQIEIDTRLGLLEIRVTPGLALDEFEVVLDNPESQKTLLRMFVDDSLVTKTAEYLKAVVE